MVRHAVEIPKVTSIQNDKPNLVTGSRLGKKLALLFLVAFAVVIGYWQLGDSLSLANLALQESQLREFQQQHPVLVYGVAFLVYVVVTGLSLPGATVTGTGPTSGMVGCGVTSCGAIPFAV